MASRRDVALAAGVSIRTVSNVVSGDVFVAPRTRDRVLAAIEQLDYRPSEVARSLRKGRSNMIAVMLPELDIPYFAELTRALVEEGAQRGYTLAVAQTDGHRDRELEMLERTGPGSMFDGLILSPLSLTPADVAALDPRGPTVFLGEKDFPGTDRVRIDNHAAARTAVAHLIDRGRRRIAMIGGDSSTATSTERMRGYEDALAEAGLRHDDELVVHVDHYTRAEGARAMRALIGRGTEFDAAFCFADPLAIGALRAMHDAGVRVPEDVAVAGFDDVDDGRFSIPSLTTIRPDRRWIARAALAHIEEKLEGAHREPRVYVAPFELIVRESTVPHRG